MIAGGGFGDLHRFAQQVQVRGHRTLRAEDKFIAMAKIVRHSQSTQDISDSFGRV
jgi:hypothetical protein